MRSPVNIADAKNARRCEDSELQHPEADIAGDIKAICTTLSSPGRIDYSVGFFYPKGL